SRFLISEVLRGAGAVLRDRSGQRFMDEVHPMAELAPRDVVSRAILDRMVATNDTHVYLDLSGIDGDVRPMFPSIARICATFDLDLARDPIPVRPGAHYFLGGAATDLDGHTSIPGLFAVGECAASGVHGANRLASNSLLEAVVFAEKAAGWCEAHLAATPLIEAVHEFCSEHLAGEWPLGEAASLLAECRFASGDTAAALSLAETGVALLERCPAPDKLERARATLQRVRAATQTADKDR
ncbi:MAG: FAD-binding protein, partial [Planctomycetes bacterium]|nr:FAD-binding protein [Planctomycetota bacterium]